MNWPSETLASSKEMGATGCDDAQLSIDGARERVDLTAWLVDLDGASLARLDGGEAGAPNLHTA